MAVGHCSLFCVFTAGSSSCVLAVAQRGWEEGERKGGKGPCCIIINVCSNTHGNKQQEEHALHSLRAQCIIRAFIQLFSYSSLHSLIHSCSLLAYILKLQSLGLGLGLGHTQGGAVNVVYEKGKLTLNFLFCCCSKRQAGSGNNNINKICTPLAAAACLPALCGNSLNCYEFYFWFSNYKTC